MADIAGKVKRRLKIPAADISFDAEIADYVQESVANLFPVVMDELDPETYALTADTNEIDLSTLDGDVRSIRRLEVFDSGTSKYHNYDEFTQHKRTLYLSRDFIEAKTLRLWPLGPYTSESVPAELEQVVINWSQSEFFSSLVGDARKYNLYTQASGRSKADNMADLSDRYWTKGNQLLIDRAKVRGQA